MNHRNQINLLAASVLIFMASLFATLLGVFMSQMSMELPDVPRWYIVIMVTLPVLTYILFDLIACSTLDRLRRYRQYHDARTDGKDTPKDPFMTFMNIIFSKEQ